MGLKETLWACTFALGCSEVLVLDDETASNEGGSGGAGDSSTSTKATTASATTGTGSVTICEDNPCALATGFESSDLAIDDDFVYVTSRSDGSVFRVSKSGGELVSIAQVDGAATSIALSWDAAVWGSDGGVWRAPKTGGDPALLAAAPGGVTAVAIGADVYFANGGTNGSIASVPIDGGAPTVIADTMLPIDLTVFSPPKNWSSLFFTSHAGGLGSLHGVYLDGQSSPDLLNDNFVSPTAVLADFEGIYVADAGMGAVVRLESSGPSELLVASLDGPSGLALDSELLYVTVHGSGTSDDGSIIAVGRTRATGILPIASGLVGPTAIVADADAIYWIERSPERALMKLRKR